MKGLSISEAGHEGTDARDRELCNAKLLKRMVKSSASQAGCSKPQGQHYATPKLHERGYENHCHFFKAVEMGHLKYMQ